MTYVLDTGYEQSQGKLGWRAQTLVTLSSVNSDSTTLWWVEPNSITSKTQFPQLLHAEDSNSFTLYE